MKLIIALCVAFFLALGSSGDVIDFVHESATEVTGTLDGEPFRGTFVITARGDTADRERDTDREVWWIEHRSAAIAIEGLGEFDFITPTRTFVNNRIGIVGFARAERGVGDLFDGPTHRDFRDWDMLTSIGPLAGNDGFVASWDVEPVQTTGGVLVLDEQFDLSATFTATVIPAPQTIAFLGPAAFFFMKDGRRRG